MKQNRGLVFITFLSVLMISFFISCSKDEEAWLEVDTLNVSVSNDDNAVAFTVNSNVQWTTSQSGNYTFNVTPSSAASGSTTVSVSAPVNTTASAREAVLTIRGGGVVKNVNLIQPSVTLSIIPDQLEIENSESSKTFLITSNAPWTIVTDNLPEWIKSIQPSSGNGNGEVTVTVYENKNRKEKNRHVLKIRSAGSLTTFAIEQAPALNTPPTAPTGLVPEKGATGVSVLPLFRWNASTDAEEDEISYTVSFSKDQITWTHIPAGMNLSVIANSSSGLLEANTKYYFKVTADDGYNEGTTESEVVTFTTGERDVYGDGDYLVYQKSSKPNPIKLVFTGDGYLAEHFRYGGLFDQDVDEGIEGLFSIEPYKTYRDYFTVYKVAAYSREEGITNKTENVKKNTVFSCVMEGGGATDISCNTDKVFSYVLKIPGMTSDDLKNNSIAVIINADVYAGTCVMWNDGRSIGMVPVHKSAKRNERFVNLLCHEYGGHGFGRLADEYCYYDDMLPNDQKDYLQTFQKYGYYLNLSVTSDEERVPWKSFMGRQDYAHVGIFTGGFLYRKGVWRSEQISCMDDNRMYFNTQSRYLIYERIMKVAGETPSVEEFIANDVEKTDHTAVGIKVLDQVPYDFKPLARPVMIKVK